MRFSHIYLKMPSRLAETRILEVFKVDDKHDLSDGFLEYDTTTVNYDHYKLPDGKLLVLLLMSKNQLWTTVRSWSAEKEVYYRKLRGKIVSIDIEVKK